MNQETFSPQENAAKYGEPDKDLISQWAQMHALLSIAHCLTAAHKYNVRFYSKSAKSGNGADLKKAADYIRRSNAIAERYKETMDLILYPYADAGTIRETLRNLATLFPILTNVPELPY